MKYHIVTPTQERVYADTLKEAKDIAIQKSKEAGASGIFCHDKDGFVTLVIFYFDGKIDDVEEL